MPYCKPKKAGIRPLRQDGFLLLGKAESLVHRFQSSLFMPTEHQQAKIYTKVPEAYWLG